MIHVVTNNLTTGTNISRRLTFVFSVLQFLLAEVPQ